MAFQPTAERRPQISSAPTQSSLDHHELYHEAPVIPAFSPRLHGGFREAEEREWVVFSPSVTVEPSNYTVTEVETNVGHSEFWTEDTVSRLSGTQGPSYVDETEEHEEEEEEEADINDEEYNQMEYDEYQDDEDSLGPFIEHQRGHPVLLPAHDGRGMFPTGITHEEESAIPGIASLEESLRLLTARNNIFDEAESLNSRIQRWREEHSTAFMEEIEMARKQKQRRRDQASKLSSEKEREEEMVASMMLDDDDVEEPVAAVDADEKAEVESENVEVSETFWRRITRSLMRDIMGIDDKVLEIIFGDTFPPLATTSTLQDTHINDDVVGVQWERSLLETIARELGILLQQYTAHPTQGAFSTYSQQAIIQLQNSGNEVEAEGAQTPRPRTLHRQKSEPDTITNLTGVSSLSEVNFKPTLSNSRQDLFSKHRAAMQGEPDRQHSAAEARAEAQRRKEYWEQELGVRVFFSYLKSRFSSNSSHQTSSKSARRAMTTAAAETHKPFYHQHPLIQRRHQPRKSTSGSTHSGQAPMGMSWGLMGMGGYRNGSSCASQSTKTSKRAGKGKGTQSSAGSVGTAAASTLSKGFYWEVETSVGSAGGGGSCVGVGPWGES